VVKEFRQKAASRAADFSQGQCSLTPRGGSIAVGCSTRAGCHAVIDD